MQLDESELVNGTRSLNQHNLLEVGFTFCQKIAENLPLRFCRNLLRLKRCANSLHVVHTKTTWKMLKLLSILFQKVYKLTWQWSNVISDTFFNYCWWRKTDCYIDLFKLMWWMFCYGCFSSIVANFPTLIIHSRSIFVIV